MQTFLHKIRAQDAIGAPAVAAICDGAAKPLVKGQSPLELFRKKWAAGQRERGVKPQMACVETWAIVRAEFERLPPEIKDKLLYDSEAPCASLSVG
eukprot:8509876-Pyramimonas_sp.AAC.1